MHLYARESPAWAIICLLTDLALRQMTFSLFLAFFVFGEIAILVRALKSSVLLFLVVSFVDVLVWPVYVAMFGLACGVLAWHASLVGGSNTACKFKTAWWEMWEDGSICPLAMLNWRDYILWDRPRNQ